MLRRSLNLARRPTRALAAVPALALSVLIAGCQPSASQRTEANTVVGVGATFPAPLYTRWAQQWRTASGVSVNYQGIGSGGGIKQILAKTADFGASDKPLTPDQLGPPGLYQFPTVVGGVTPIVNVPGVGPGQLKLTGALLGDIYLGAVMRWNDPRIAVLNPGLKLPDKAIAVVHRSDGSGTTFLFTTYLSQANSTWKAKVGANDALAWPNGMAAKGNGGVAVSVRQTVGAIGYVEYAYARHADLAVVQLQNHDGAFVAPTPEGFAAAVADADWAKSPGNDVLLIDQPGASTWPITGATFILIYKQPPQPAKTR
ncbi:MAG TPA: phosphate ABC transporter substrate-binding protein PstS, partial [Caulobacteraceae bacterium]|nr:phosphate ABC transporter substrate-binding protein PstS [Caulobacteraceae bacterium]